MKKINSILFIAMLFLTLNSFAAPKADSFKKNDPFSKEISRILSGSSLVAEKDFTLTIFFSVTQDKRLQVRSISSPYPQLNEYFINKLQGKVLYESNLVSNKIYELPVRVKAVR